jgi:ubiquinone/menaquinone biosynthesis C-methylase UbiE
MSEDMKHRVGTSVNQPNINSECSPNIYMSHHRHAIDPERRKWQNPETILANTGLKAGLTFMDIGCGGGFFALPAARIVGESGKVYGIDTNAESISELRELASREGLNNLELIVGRAEDMVMCESCADIVFFGIVLHDFENPAKVLKNAKKMLNPAGRLIDLDWKKTSTPLGPPLQIRFSEEKSAQLIESAGFEVVSINDVGPYHYMIVAKPY